MPSLQKPKDLVAGCLFLVTGLVVLYVASGYTLGNLRRMGPGYFPVMLGALLCILALFIIAGSFRGQRDSLDPISVNVLRTIIVVLGSAAVFGLTVRWAGLVPSIFAMSFLGCFAMPRYGLLPALATAGVLALGSATIFGWMLTQPIPMFTFF